MKDDLVFSILESNEKRIEYLEKKILVLQEEIELIKKYNERLDDL